MKLIAVTGTVAVVAVVTTVPTVEIGASVKVMGAFCDITSCEVRDRQRNGRMNFFTDPVFGVGAQNVEPVRVLGIICRGSKC